MNTSLHQNRPGETQNWSILHLEPHDFRIYYVNIDLRQLYGISVADSQTFLASRNVPSGEERGETDVFAG